MRKFASVLVVYDFEIIFKNALTIIYDVIEITYVFLWWVCPSVVDSVLL